MYYSEAAESIKKLMDEEDLLFSDSFMEYFLEIMSEMCNYSEEDHRIRPQMIVGKNINNYFETISSRDYFVMSKDELTGDEFPRFFKSLALFCDNGWYIVVNMFENKLEYGLFRRYTDISGNRFEDFFHDTFSKDLKCNMIIIKARNNYEISITKENRSEDFTISQKYTEKKVSTDSEIVYKDLTDDILSNRNDYNPEHVHKCFMKMFRLLPQKVHGTILLVVADSFVLNNESLSGIEITPSIDYYKKFSQYDTVGSYQEAESIYSLTGMLYEMLNTDGITIITDRGRVIYYNVFYEGTIPLGIKGGARKRTAKGILENTELEGVKGVYFQSQDGEIFYCRKEEYR